MPLQSSSQQVQIATIVHNALYNTNDKSLQEQAYQFIDNNCSFVDPVVTLYTKREIICNFALVRGLHPQSEIHHISIDNVVIFDATITYWVLFIPITIRQFSKFRLADNGGIKVVKIEDIWSLNDLFLNIPIYGRFHKLFKYIVGIWLMLFSTVLLRISGEKEYSYSKASQ